MKKKLLSIEILSSLLLMALSTNLSVAQQSIGQFPVMDGGFEAQTITSMDVIIPHAANWTMSTTPASTTRTVINNPLGARSGNKYITFSNAASGNTRLQSPIASTLAAGTQYTVQYYFKAAVSPLAYLTGAVYFNTTGTNAAIIAKPTLFVPNTWMKASATFTSTATAGTPRFASPRINGVTNTTDVINIDDFVVYSGGLDETAPDAPSDVVINGLSVSWTPPVTGVDGGGYVVVRYSTIPAANNAPKQNGIYQVGNVITEGNASLSGTVVYIGTNTAFTDAVSGSVSGQDFYKVYTVDKAFNYSSEANLGIEELNHSSAIAIYPNPVKDNRFTISLPESVSGKIILGIYNVSGQLGYKKEFTVTENLIKVNLDKSLTPGIYIVKLEYNGKTTVQKITVI